MYLFYSVCTYRLLHLFLSSFISLFLEWVTHFFLTHHNLFLEIDYLLPCLLSVLLYVLIKNHALHLKDFYKPFSCLVGDCALEQNVKSRDWCRGNWRVRQMILKQPKKSQRLKWVTHPYTRPHSTKIKRMCPQTLCI